MSGVTNKLSMADQDAMLKAPVISGLCTSESGRHSWAHKFNFTQTRRSRGGVNISLRGLYRCKNCLGFKHGDSQ